jgi:hypothetical protein
VSSCLRRGGVQPECANEERDRREGERVARAEADVVERLGWGMLRVRGGLEMKQIYSERRSIIYSERRSLHSKTPKLLFPKLWFSKTWSANSLLILVLRLIFTRLDLTHYTDFPQDFSHDTIFLCDLAKTFQDWAKVLEKVR